MALKSYIREMGKQAEIQEADGSASALNLLDKNQYDLMILDIRIPDGSALELIEKTRQIHPLIKILMYSGHDERINAIRYIQAGANGYLWKGASSEEHVLALGSMFNTGQYISSNLQQYLIETNQNHSSYIDKSNPISSLTKREQQVMELLLEGKWNKEIAYILNLKENTISTYKTQILEKMGVENIIELAKKMELYT